MEFNEYINSLPKVKADKLSPEEFFNLIIESEENTSKFIKELFAPAVKGRVTFDLRSSYHGVMAAYTNVDNLSIAKNKACNFTAFLAVLLHEFYVSKDYLKILIKAGDEPTNQNPALKKPRRYGHSKDAVPKDKRPAAKVYFKEMTSSRESLISFIQEHLAPAVIGRTQHNVGGAYYGALAKNTCEVSANIVSNTACNYKAFRKKLEFYSISSEELSQLLTVEVNYKPSKKASAVRISKKERVLNILRDKLGKYEVDNEELEKLITNLYTEIAPIIRRNK